MTTALTVTRSHLALRALSKISGVLLSPTWLIVVLAEMVVLVALVVAPGVPVVPVVAWDAAVELVVELVVALVQVPMRVLEQSFQE